MRDDLTFETWTEIRQALQTMRAQMDNLNYRQGVYVCSRPRDPELWLKMRIEYEQARRLVVDFHEAAPKFEDYPEAVREQIQQALEAELLAAAEKARFEGGDHHPTQ